MLKYIFGCLQRKAKLRWPHDPYVRTRVVRWEYASLILWYNSVINVMMFLFSAKTSALSLILTFPQKMLRAFFSRFCWDNTFSVIRITTSLEFLETWKCRGILQRSGKGHRVRKSELVWSEIFDCDILACNNMLVSLKNALQLNILLHLFDIFVYTSDVQVDFGHLLKCCENFVTSRIGVN